MPEENKTREQRINELMEQPVDASTFKGPSLQDIVRDAPEEEPTPSADPEEDPSQEDADPDDEGGKVEIPRSRLKTLTERGKKADKVEELEKQIAELQAAQSSLQANSQKEEEIPKEWVDLYGDSPESKAAYQASLRVFRGEIERANAEQEQARLAAEKERQETINSIEQSFDTQMDALEEQLGRKLTEKQKEGIMGVVEKYSPRNPDDPEYYDGYISIESAYEIYNSTNSKTDPAKKEVARIAAASPKGQNTEAPNMTIADVRNWRSRYRHLGL